VQYWGRGGEWQGPRVSLSRAQYSEERETSKAKLRGVPEAVTVGAGRVQVTDRAEGESRRVAFVVLWGIASDL